MSKSKHFCFTLNNYSEEEHTHINGLHEREEITYIIVAEEIGENQTPHLQGFISFKTRKRLLQVKRLLSDRSHVEICRGTPAQAAEYCRKDGKFIEHGSIPGGRGHRSDIDKLTKAIREGQSRNRIRDEFPLMYLRYSKCIEKWISDLQPSRDWIVDVVVHWGKTGTGKTRSVFEFTNRQCIYVHPGEQWFDGYEGQSVVLFDDFNGSEFKLSYLLKLLDRYPMKVPVKGNYVNWIPKHIFITSNKSPDEWYPNAYEEHKNALKRRISLIKHFA